MSPVAALKQGCKLAAKLASIQQVQDLHNAVTRYFTPAQGPWASAQGACLLMAAISSADKVQHEAVDRRLALLMARLGQTTDQGELRTAIREVSNILSACMH